MTRREWLAAQTVLRTIRSAGPEGPTVVVRWRPGLPGAGRRDADSGRGLRGRGFPLGGPEYAGHESVDSVRSLRLWLALERGPIPRWLTCGGEVRLHSLSVRQYRRLLASPGERWLAAIRRPLARST